jgi:hypothetical protein
LSIIDNGELRTDWHVLNLSSVNDKSNKKQCHYETCFTPHMELGNLPFQMLLVINNQFFHLYILRQNSTPNEGVQIKFETFFIQTNQIISQLKHQES